MPFYKIKSKSRSWDGEPVGILILDAAYPCVPGNVGNATTFPFPVRYHEVRGASIDRLLNQRDPALLAPFIEGAQKLEAEGHTIVARGRTNIRYFVQGYENKLWVFV